MPNESLKNLIWDLKLAAQRKNKKMRLPVRQPREQILNWETSVPKTNLESLLAPIWSDYITP